MTDTNTLEAEVARLQDIIDKSDSARWLEAVQRACDERLTALKHDLRQAEARIAALEAEVVRLRGLESFKHERAVFFEERAEAAEHRIAALEAEAAHPLQKRS